jgi:membrane associated rhomboid family serine protease
MGTPGDEPYRRRGAPVTGALILANVAVFALQSLTGDALLAPLALWPVGRLHAPGIDGVVGFRPWQLVTSAFLHGNVAHLLLNMLALRIFGRDVERALGARHYLVLYVAAVLSAGCVQVAVTSMASGRPFPTVGASGGVFGVLLAFAVLYPRRLVVLLFPPIPMPAWFFVTAYGLIELVNGVLGTVAGVAHFAHLGGMVGAWIVLRRWRGSSDRNDGSSAW